MIRNLTARLFGTKLSNVAAKNRLQMVLVQDRSGLTSIEMELFKKDLLGVISKYFVIENKSLDVEWKRTDSETELVINTPINGKLRAVPREEPVTKEVANKNPKEATA